VGALLEQVRQIVIDGQCRVHVDMRECVDF
jgi:hypothetical protein